jgi:hypothetical protein
MLTQYRREKRYTIQSDQTEREAPWGELDETVIHQNADGTLTLGRPLAELARDSKQTKREADLQRLVAHLEAHPDSDKEQIVKDLSMSPNYLLDLVGMAGERIHSTGKGVKGDPRLYSVKPYGLEAYSQTIPAPEAAVSAQRIEEVVHE